MKQSAKPQATLDDVMFLLQKVYEKADTHEQRLDVVEQKIEELKTSVANLAGDVKDIQENTTVLSYHNSEHFDKDDEQDKRLDTHAKKIGLPAFDY